MSLTSRAEDTNLADHPMSTVYSLLYAGLVRAIKRIQMDENDPDRHKVRATRCETGIELEILPEHEHRRSKKLCIYHSFTFFTFSFMVSPSLDHYHLYFLITLKVTLKFLSLINLVL